MREAPGRLDDCIREQARPRSARAESSSICGYRDLTGRTIAHRLDVRRERAATASGGDGRRRAMASGLRACRMEGQAGGLAGAFPIPPRLIGQLLREARGGKGHAHTAAVALVRAGARLLPIVLRLIPERKSPDREEPAAPRGERRFLLSCGPENGWERLTDTFHARDSRPGAAVPFGPIGQIRARCRPPERTGPAPRAGRLHRSGAANAAGALEAADRTRALGIGPPVELARP